MDFGHPWAPGVPRPYHAFVAGGIGAAKIVRDSYKDYMSSPRRHPIKLAGRKRLRGQEGAPTKRPRQSLQGNTPNTCPASNMGFRNMQWGRRQYGMYSRSMRKGARFRARRTSRIRRNIRRPRYARRRRYTRRRRNPAYGRGKLNYDDCVITDIIRVGASGYSTPEVAANYVGMRSTCLVQFNPLWFTDLLGGHGKFDLVGLNNTATGITSGNITSGQVTRVFAHESRVSAMPFYIRRQRINLTLSPDWQAQGTPMETDATPKFGDDAHMVVTIYKFIARKVLNRTEYVSSAVDVGSAVYRVGGGIASDDVARQDYAAQTGTGIFGEWAEGLRRRVNLRNALVGTTVLGVPTVTQVAAPFNVSPLVSTATPPPAYTKEQLLKWGVMTADHITPYMSPNIQAKYRVTHKSYKIYPGQARTVNISLPDYKFNNAEMELDYPLENLKSAQLRKYPKNFPALLIATKIVSNKANRSVLPAVLFDARMVYKCRFHVPGSKDGGNLIIQNENYIQPPTETGAAIGVNVNPFPIMPQNPVRDVRTAYPAGDFP